MVPSPLREARLRRFVIVDDENHEDQLHCNASMAITTFNSNLFEKSSCKLSSSLRSIQSSGPRSPSGRRSKARSEIGIFLDRLFPHGTFLDGLACERPGRCSFYIPLQCRSPLQHRGIAEANADRAPRRSNEQSPSPSRTKASKSFQGADALRHNASEQHPKKKPTPLDAASCGSEASNPLPNGSCASGAEQPCVPLANDAKQPGAKVRCADREERRQRILQQRLEEQRQYEVSLKSEAQLQAESAAHAKAEARAARIRERQQAAQQQAEKRQQQAEKQRQAAVQRALEQEEQPTLGQAFSEADAEVSSPLREAREHRLFIVEDDKDQGEQMQEEDIEATGGQPQAAAPLPRQVGVEKKREEMGGGEAEQQRRNAASEAKRTEQEAAAARKEAAQRERAERQRRANEEKAARQRRFKEERLAAATAQAEKLGLGVPQDRAGNKWERECALQDLEGRSMPVENMAASEAAERAAARVAAKEEVARAAKRAAAAEAAERLAAIRLREQQAKADAAKIAESKIEEARARKKQVAVEGQAAGEAAAMARARQRLAELESKVSAVAWSWTDKCNGWWCDVAADGCLRPCDSDDYAPAVRFANGGGYVACEECFDSHLSQPEQRRGFIRVEPVSEPRG